jgi:CRISPR-associated protein Cas1
MMSKTAGETSIEVSPLVPARILNEYTYCPRLAYLEWVQGEFMESADTLDGTLRHRRVDRETGDLAENLSQTDAEQPDTVHARSVTLSADGLGLIARIDLIESSGPEVMPVDYKRGRMPDIPERAWEPDRVQLCAQGLILRENGYDCKQGVVYYISSKTRVTVEFDERLRARTLELLDQLKQMADGGKIPTPLNDSPKCEGCSLAGICLPDEVNLLSRIAGSGEQAQEPRRLVPASDDRVPVYVQEQGAVVSKKGDVLQIKREGTVVDQARLLEVSQLNVFGNVQISTQLLRELVGRGIPVCYFTYGAWFDAVLCGLGNKNVELRQRQFALARDDKESLRFASRFVNGKIKNARTMLRRNAVEPQPGALAELSRLASQAVRVSNSESLLGTEGAAARTYFSHFNAMLKPRFRPDFDFRNRNRRPPADPVNALLSFVYSLLTKDLHATLLVIGFDPLLGFLHRPRYGKPALALDLAEEFRPLLGDSVVLTVVNSAEIGPQDFVQRGSACSLTPSGRRKMISAYERRLSTEVRHPIFGYSVSYRRVLEVQARLLARCVAGEVQTYVPFVTR